MLYISAMYRLICCVMILLGLSLPAAGVQAQSGFQGKVVVIQVGADSLTNSQNFRFMRRIIDQAEKEKARALVFELNTPGGLAWETGEMMMQTMQGRKLPMYAFVNTKAMSAGALLSAACDKIYMAPVSTIGAAGLVSGTGDEIEPMMRRKLESAFDAFTRSVVVRKGHDPALIRAMMVPSKDERKFGSVTVAPDTLLTLTGEEAAAPGADGRPLLAAGIVANVEELMAKEGIESPVVTAEPTGFEQIAFWLAWASPLLILAGMAGIYFELKTPGFGVGGIIAVASFALFFLGNHVVGNLAGYEMAALFVLGVALLIVEIVLGGSTVFVGAAGVLCMLAALFGGMLDGLEVGRLLDADAPSWQEYAAVAAEPALKLALGCVGGTLAILGMMRCLPELPLFRRLNNSAASGVGAGSPPGEDEALPAQEGESVTELNPGGRAVFGGRMVDVSSVSGVIPAHSRVRVVGRNAFETLVEKID